MSPVFAPMDEAERAKALTALLADAGWSGAARQFLAGDASFRKYHRLERPDGSRAVLMDAAPPMEDVRPFLRIARHLVDLGFSAPRILGAEETAGWLLLEDLGDATYTRLLARGQDEESLYALAVDVLIALHGLPESRAVPSETPPYDDQRLLDEALLFCDWYLPAVMEDGPDASARGGFIDVLEGLFPLLHAVPRTLVLRDFHVDNLLLLDGRRGIAACGLLDFQDAVSGPGAYDMMSLLEDARRDIDPLLVEHMIARYLEARPEVDPDAFATAWAVLAAQRHLKVLGIFTRLDVRDGKSHYLEHVPRLWGLLERACRHPALTPVRDWLERHVPAEARIRPVAYRQRQEA